MAKYKSRSRRAYDTAGTYRDLAERLREIEVEDDATDQQKEEAIKAARVILDEFDAGEVESLAEEMGTWRDNLSGTSLADTETGQRVDEAASTLENIETECPDLDDAWDIEQAADELESRADELESIDFPGMFGR